MIKAMDKARVPQFLFVIDLANVCLESRHNAFFIKAVAKINEIHYPEYFYRVICVNAPKIIKVLYALIKMVLPERTKNKVSFYEEHDTPAAMQSILSSNDIPERYGGTIPDIECFTEGSVDMSPLKQWRERQMHPHNAKNIVLSARESKTKSIRCDDSSIVKWWFTVKHNDICFGVRWKKDLHDWIVIREPIRCGNEGHGAHRFPVHDEYKTDGAGTMEFEFSNKHSRMSSKSIDYHLQIVACAKHQNFSI